MSITIAEALTRWVAFRARCVALNLTAASTHENQSRIAGIFAAAPEFDRPLSDLRRSEIQLWMGSRLQSCVPVTVRGELNVMRQFLNWCVDEQLIDVRPRMPHLQVPKTEEALPAEEAFLWALKAVPERHREALEFMMLTGLSPHEAERLQVRDYCWNSDGSIGVGQRDDFRVKTASRKRIIPMNPRARQLWGMMVDGKRPLDFALPKAATMQKALVRARAHDKHAPKDAHRVTPKLMRQWFASKVAGEQPEHVLQRLLGHSPGSRITRRHYVRSSDEALNNAVEGLRA